MKYITLNKNGKSIEITDRDLEAIQSKVMRVRWELKNPDIVVTDNIGYRHFLNEKNKNVRLK